jgi:hypothetical protein
LNYDAQAAVQSELRGGEKLLWAGQPLQGIRFRRADALLIPFTLLWAGFAVYWEWSVLQQDAPGFFALWGIPFVLVGIYIVIGRFFVDAWQRARTYYAVTTERALLVSGLRTREVRSFPLRMLNDVSLREAADGSGVITLGSGSGRPGMAWFAGSGWPGMSRYMPPAFELGGDVRRIYELIRSSQRDASRVGA